MVCSTTESSKNAPKILEDKDTHFEEKDIRSSEKKNSVRQNHPQNDKEQSLVILRKVIFLRTSIQVVLMEIIDL